MVLALMAPTTFIREVLSHSFIPQMPPRMDGKSKQSVPDLKELTFQREGEALINSCHKLVRDYQV